MKTDDKKVAAIVIDGWKRGIFERRLCLAGYTWTIPW